MRPSPFQPTPAPPPAPAAARPKRRRRAAGQAKTCAPLCTLASVFIYDFRIKLTHGRASSRPRHVPVAAIRPVPPAGACSAGAVRPPRGCASAVRDAKRGGAGGRARARQGEVDRGQGIGGERGSTHANARRGHTAPKQRPRVWGGKREGAQCSAARRGAPVRRGPANSERTPGRRGLRQAGRRRERERGGGDGVVHRAPTKAGKWLGAGGQAARGSRRRWRSAWPRGCGARAQPSAFRQSRGGGGRGRSDFAGGRCRS